MADTDHWAVAVGDDEGKKLIYRIRLEPPAFATKVSCTRFLVVRWTFEPPNDTGLPAEAELERMTACEDLLQPAMENAHQGFLAVIITGKQAREWFWYVRDCDETMAIANTALAAAEMSPLEFHFEGEDPDWNVYSQFREIALK